MRERRPHANSNDRPLQVDRARNLPADVLHGREVEWLRELEFRLAAVEAWRGQAVSGSSAACRQRPAA